MLALCSSLVTTSMRLGDWVIWAAILPTMPSRVAENNRVWRLLGVRETMCSMSSTKPMSSMRSASSSTSTSRRGEVDAATLHVVDQAARGGDHDFRVVAHGLELGAEGGAAHQADGAQLLDAGAVDAGLLLHLQGQFAGGAQHQQARALDLAGAGDLGRLGQLVQAGQQEGGGLAAAGVAGNQQILAFEGGGNGLALYPCRLGVAGGFKTFQNDGVQTQFGEAHGDPFQYLPRPAHFRQRQKGHRPRSRGAQIKKRSRRRDRERSSVASILAKHRRQPNAAMPNRRKRVP
jgi:hypothetical protein